MCNRTFPAEERGRALGVNSVFVSLGMAFGPTVGGLLLSGFSWKALFWFNVPFAILGLIATIYIIKPDELDDTKDRRMDWTGSFVFALSVGCMAVAINFCDDWGLTNPRFICVASCAVLALALFIFRETKAPVPLMHLNLFKFRTFSLSSLAAMFSYMTQQLNTFLTPFFIMNILLISKANSGFIMLAQPLMMMIFSPVGGIMSDKVGCKPPSLLGLGLILLGCFIMSGLTVSSTLIPVILSLICFGIGNAVSVSAINASIYHDVPKKLSGMASGMVATMRNLGQGLGTAFAGMIIAFRETALIKSMNLSGSTPETYVGAQHDTYIFAVVIVTLAIITVLCTPNTKKRKNKQY